MRLYTLNKEGLVHDKLVVVAKLPLYYVAGVPAYLQAVYLRGEMQGNFKGILNMADFYVDIGYHIVWLNEDCL